MRKSVSPQYRPKRKSANAALKKPPKDESYPKDSLLVKCAVAADYPLYNWDSHSFRFATGFMNKSEAKRFVYRWLNFNTYGSENIVTDLALQYNKALDKELVDVNRLISRKQGDLPCRHSLFNYSTIAVIIWRCFYRKKVVDNCFSYGETINALLDYLEFINPDYNPFSGVRLFYELLADQWNTILDLDRFIEIHNLLSNNLEKESRYRLSNDTILKQYKHKLVIYKSPGCNPHYCIGFNILKNTITNSFVNNVDRIRINRLWPS